MDRNNYVAAFASLGQALGMASSLCEWEKVKKESIELNPWFDALDIDFAIERWSENLTEQNLQQWLGNYPDLEGEPKKVGIVMPGNIPLVGFHDFLCVLVAGHSAVIKLSSDDPCLLPFWAKILVEIEPRFAERIQFEEKLFDIDAVIATGSDNTASYFEHYFGQYPHIIRKNRCSIAILTGKEENMPGLAEDILRYKGLGCCSVSKIFVPEDYSFEGLKKATQKFDYLKDHPKYRNNLEYYRAIYTMNGIPFLDFGNVILIENKDLHSPISVVYYEKHEDLDHVGAYNGIADKVQRVISEIPTYENATPLGSAQKPYLWDYMDGVDTMKFLLSL